VVLGWLPIWSTQYPHSPQDVLLDERSSECSSYGVNQSLAVRDRLKTWLKNLSLENLPVSTVRQLRKTVRDTIRSYLQTRGTEFLQGLSGSLDWENIASLLSIVCGVQLL